MATQLTNYQCPACTGPLHFDGASGKLVCDFCGSSYDLSLIHIWLGAAAVAAELTGVGSAAAAYPAGGCGCRGRLGAAAVCAEFAGVAGQMCIRDSGTAEHPHGLRHSGQLRPGSGIAAGGKLALNFPSRTTG